MKKSYSILCAALFVSATLILLAACRPSGTDITPVSGTLEAPFPVDSAPAAVLQAMQRAQRFHTYEILSDTAHDISVEAIVEADTASTGGYGLVIVKGATSTTFPHIFLARQPQARYCAPSGDLWLSASATEGTGVSIKHLCQFRFLDGDSATIVRTVDPYVLQQQLLTRLGYHIDGEQITLYDDRRPLATATNTITDMGGFDPEQPLWIGDQLQYDLSGDVPRLLLTPGVRFAVCPILFYDDMPTLSAPLTFSPDGTPVIGDLQPDAQP